MIKYTTQNSVFYDDQDNMRVMRVPNEGAAPRWHDNHWVPYSRMEYQELTEEVFFEAFDSEGKARPFVTSRVKDIEVVADESV